MNLYSGFAVEALTQRKREEKALARAKKRRAKASIFRPRGRFHRGKGNPSHCKREKGGGYNWPLIKGAKKGNGDPPEKRGTKAEKFTVR